MVQVVQIETVSLHISQDTFLSYFDLCQNLQQLSVYIVNKTSLLNDHLIHDHVMLYLSYMYTGSLAHFI